MIGKQIPLVSTKGNEKRKTWILMLGYEGLESAMLFSLFVFLISRIFAAGINQCHLEPSRLPVPVEQLLCNTLSSVFCVVWQSWAGITEDCECA